jgi:site-specific recombinase XerC
MRHSYATWLLKASADIRWVQRQLEWSKPRSQTIDTYGPIWRRTGTRHG